jgi:hypothetical protein
MCYVGPRVEVKGAAEQIIASLAQNAARLHKAFFVLAGPLD